VRFDTAYKADIHLTIVNNPYRNVSTHHMVLNTSRSMQKR
jgi:hypothetical protein